ncbi:MAG: D-2-hydroxyacid dehydrogenase [bacterium]|nr:D-2-hydroxyacid dehydrogenase [Gammaproteobacteria bacterium]HIL94536.1 D-2-hydroxyacid dehydrogenase [Pseudomonadales bacterium]
MKIVIIPGLTLPSVSEEDIERIKAVAGHNAQIVISSPKEAIDHVSDAEVILGFLPKKLFDAAPELKWVHAIASGVDAFLYPEFVKCGIPLTSEKGLVGDHLADHGFGLLLMLTRQLATALRYGADSWNHRPEMRFKEIELTGSTMGIVGFGGTGRATAKRAAAFGMNCLAMDRDPVPNSEEVKEVWSTDRFVELLEQSDVVSICCPLTSETRELFDAAAFSAMKESAFLVNVTRGEVMDETALVNALQTNEIRGAALDVAPREPLPADSPLWSMPNVVMTPHTAGASQFRAQRNIDRFISNLSKLLNDEPLEGVVDKELGY